MNRHLVKYIKFCRYTYFIFIYLLDKLFKKKNKRNVFFSWLTSGYKHLRSSRKGLLDLKARVCFLDTQKD